MRGIVTVNIGGEVRTLSLKNNFLVLLGVQLGCDPLSIPAKIADMGETNPFQIVTLIIYCGLCAYLDRTANFAHLVNVDGEQAPLSLPVVAEWMDDASDDEMKSVWSEFAEIMGFPKASEEQIKTYEADIKKKPKNKA